MTYFALPRGIGSNAGRPLATARWATAEDIARFATANERDGGAALGIGYFPHPELASMLEAGRRLAVEAWSKIAASTRPSREKVRLQQSVEKKFAALYAAACYPVTLIDDRHLLSIAGSRSGKGASSVIPALCLSMGSTVTLDPKGENAMITAERRGRGHPDWCEGLGQEVRVFDPYGVTKSTLPSELQATFNPLDLLDPRSDTFFEDVNAFADALIVPSEGGEDKHFEEMARRFIAAVICYSFCFPEMDEANKPIPPDLTRIRAFLMRGDPDAAEAERLKDASDKGENAGRIPDIDPVKAMLRIMTNSPEFANGAMANDAGALLNTGDREFGGIMTTVARATAFIDSKMMQRVLRSSEFRPEKLKSDRRGVSVYICVPPRYASTAAPWMRLLLTCFLNSLQTDLAPPANGKPVLFVLEEFAALGRMKVIEEALPYAATYGIQLWPILQDYGQLERLYGKAATSFVGNAALVEFFGNGDHQTAKLASDMLGEVEISRLTMTSNSTETGSLSTPSDQQQLRNVGRGGPFQTALGVVTALAVDPRTHQEGRSRTESVNEGLHVAPLLRADEVKALASRSEKSKIAIPNGSLPMFLHRIDYFEDPRLIGRFRPLPHHEKATRSRQTPIDLSKFDDLSAARARANEAYGELTRLTSEILA